MVIGEELDVTDVKNHMKSVLDAGRFKNFGSTLLFGGESGDQTGIGEAG